MVFDEDGPKEKPDFTLDGLRKQDLSTLSVEDLEERIANLRNEIARCEVAIGDRGATRAAAENLFKA